MGGFVGSGNPREFRNFPGSGLFVQPFGVALFTDSQIRGHVDLVEQVAGAGPHAVSVRPIGGNERGGDDKPGMGQGLRQFADASNVFLPVIGRKAQVGAKSVANIVAVQHEDLLAAPEQGLLQPQRQGRFSRTGQACEPQDAAFMAVRGPALRHVDAVFDPQDVR